MKYLIYGGSGFLGTEIVRLLKERGDEVVVADMRPPHDTSTSFVEVNLLKEIPQSSLLENPDVVINLAGKLIFGRWNVKLKKLIHDTRVEGTKHIVNSFSRENYKPTYLVNASAVGIYGDHGDDEIVETSPHGQTFLSVVAHKWEQETMKAKESGVAIRIIRNAHILGKGGLLGVLKPFYLWGLGGPLGNGTQWMPWIHITDIAQLYIQAAQKEFPEIINGVSPQTIRNKDFSKQIAKTLKRPHLFRIPQFALSLLYGEFAKEITISQKVASSHENVFSYQFDDVNKTLQNIFP